MKTPDEIKKGLECCQGAVKCEECPYETECDLPFGDDNKADALAYIQQLEADNARLTRCIENMTDKLNAAHDETVELKRERDALLEHLKIKEDNQ